MGDIHIWRTAQILTETHGEDAAMHAAIRSYDAKHEGRHHAGSVAGTSSEQSRSRIAHNEKDSSDDKPR